jgi:hypothetical protein
MIRGGNEPSLKQHDRETDDEELDHEKNDNKVSLPIFT